MTDRIDKMFEGLSDAEQHKLARDVANPRPPLRIVKFAPSDKPRWDCHADDTPLLCPVDGTTTRRCLTQRECRTGDGCLEMTRRRLRLDTVCECCRVIGHTKFECIFWKG